MKNLRIIFGIIKKYCEETGVSNEKCFTELKKLAVNNSIFFPLYTYLRVLQNIGLIKLPKFRKAITLTEKGKTTDNISMFNLPALVVLFLHMLRRLFIVACSFTLFWPMFLAVHKQYNAAGNNEGEPVQR